MLFDFRTSNPVTPVTWKKNDWPIFAVYINTPIVISLWYKFYTKDCVNKSYSVYLRYHVFFVGTVMISVKHFYTRQRAAGYNRCPARDGSWRKQSFTSENGCFYNGCYGVLSGLISFLLVRYYNSNIRFVLFILSKN